MIIFREKVGAHSDAGHAGFEPAFQVLPGRFHAAGNHDLAPRHRCPETFDEGRPENVAGEHLADIAAGFLCRTDLADRAAARAVRDQPAVADRSDGRIEQGADDKVGAELDVEGGRTGIHDGPDADDHAGKFLVGVLDEFAEDLLGEITAVGEFEGADTAVIAGLEDLFGDIDIRMVEDRDHAGLFHRLDDFEFAVFCHDLTYFRQR